MLLVTFLLCDLVYAKDGGMPPNFAQAKVHITVMDENDNAPTFGRLQYSLELPENLDPVEIFIIKATDHDSGDSGRVEYRITGKYHPYMMIQYILYHILEIKYMYKACGRLTITPTYGLFPNKAHN